MERSVVLQYRSYSLAVLLLYCAIVCNSQKLDEMHSRYAV